MKSLASKKLTFQVLLDLQYYFLVGTVATGILSSVVFITHKISTQPNMQVSIENEPISISSDLPNRTYMEPLIDTVIVRAVKVHSAKRRKEEPVF